MGLLKGSGFLTSQLSGNSSAAGNGAKSVGFGKGKSEVQTLVPPLLASSTSIN